MVIIYIDESGINQGFIRGGFYKDGPFIIWSGLFISEQKYFHLERQFYSLVSSILGIKDWQSTELHATDIWNRSGDFSGISERKSREYFEEVFQLLSKMSLNLVFTVHQKNSKIRSVTAKQEEIRKSIQAFLHGLEYQLAEISETGVLVADQISRKKGEYTEMENLILDRTKWRNLGKNRFKYKQKYKYEAQSCFILDQVNYTDSKNSLFIQLEDHISFILQRVFTHQYLIKYPKGGIVADVSKVPLTQNTFKMFFNRTSPTMTYWDTKGKDVSIGVLETNLIYGDNEEYLNLSVDSFTPYK